MLMITAMLQISHVPLSGGGGGGQTLERQQFLETRYLSFPTVKHPCKNHLPHHLDSWHL